jgi:hypothetical protein
MRECWYSGKEEIGGDMEKTLIVLLDPEAQTIFLFGEYNKQISFDELYLLKVYLEGRNVMFVTQAEETAGESVLELINSMVSDNPATPGEPRFLRCKKEGYTSVPDIGLKFSGPKDAKPMDKLGYDIFDRSPMLKKLLFDGIVEVLTQSQAEKLRKPRPKPVGQSSILINRKEDILENDEMFNGENDITEDTKVETDEDIAIKQKFGK